MKGCKTVLRLRNYAEYRNGAEVIGIYVDLRKRKYFLRVYDRVLNEEIYTKFTNRFDVLRDEIKEVVK